MRKIGHFFTAALTIWLVLTGVASGDEPAKTVPRSSADAVKITSASSKPDGAGRQTVILTFEIEKDWYFLANPVGHDAFVPTLTVVKAEDSDNLREFKVEYPVGTTRKNMYVGDYNIYEGKVQVRVILQKIPGNNDPIKLSIRWQACHDEFCTLKPARVTITVR